MDRIEKLKKFLVKSPTDPFIQHALALEYIKIGDDISARTLFEQLLTANPLYAGSYYHLGKLLERNGDIENAKRIYQQGIAAARANADLHTQQELQAALLELTD